MATALAGMDGWYFLADDGYRSVDQYTGRLKISETDLDQWRVFFASMGALRGSPVKHLCILAPSKEKVFPRFYPHARSAETTMEQLQRVASPGDIYYPIDLLNDPQSALLTYPRTDTHWSDFGAMLVAEDVARRLGGVGKTVAPSRFSKGQALYDLGIKLSPPLEEETFVCDSLQTMRVFDNQMTNVGRIMIFDNAAAMLGVCVIFGDSFGLILCKWLKWVFRRIVFVFSTDVDWSVIANEKAEYVITQKGERGITSALTADPAFRIKVPIARKIFAPDNAKLAEQIEAYKSYFGEDPVQA